VLARLIANHLILSFFKSVARSQGPSLRQALPGLNWYYDPVRLPSDPPPGADVGVCSPIERVSPIYPHHHSKRAMTTTPADRMGAPRLLPHPHGLPHPVGRSASTTLLSRPAQTSLALRPRWIAQPPKAAFVTRLRPDGYPYEPLVQLPDQSTALLDGTLSSIGDTRLLGRTAGTTIRQFHESDSAAWGHILDAILNLALRRVAGASGNVSSTALQRWNRTLQDRPIGSRLCGAP